MNLPEVENYNHRTRLSQFEWQCLKEAVDIWREADQKDIEQARVVCWDLLTKTDTIQELKLWDTHNDCPNVSKILFLYNRWC